MNYAQIIAAIRNCCETNLSVNSFHEGDVYVINSESNTYYATTILTPQTHSINQSINTYNFNLFYVDRLTTDRDNKIDIQSTAITTLKEIINRLIEKYDLDINYTYSVNVFTERFSDECAGAFITFSIIAEDVIGECYYDEI